MSKKPVMTGIHAHNNLPRTARAYLRRMGLHFDTESEAVAQLVRLHADSNVVSVGPPQPEAAHRKIARWLGFGN